jgi:crossover junction endonuclease MUS81
MTSHNVTLRLDYRETKLYNALVPIVSENIESVNLEIGDIEICCIEPEIRFIFERKTQSDLLSSITDGRYREQKIRILSQLPAHRCTYIIEGGDIIANTTDWNFPRMSPSVYDGAILHTMYRDKMHVICTKDVDHTAQFIATIFKKMQGHPEKFIDTQCEYISQIKVKSKKCENISPSICFILQLSQIPGISSKIAQEIVKVYPTWKEIFIALNGCENTSKKKELLCAIAMVGGKKADAIIEYLQI